MKFLEVPFLTSTNLPVSVFFCLSVFFWLSVFSCFSFQICLSVCLSVCLSAFFLYVSLLAIPGSRPSGVLLASIALRNNRGRSRWFFCRRSRLCSSPAIEKWIWKSNGDSFCDRLPQRRGQLRLQQINLEWSFLRPSQMSVDIHFKICVLASLQEGGSVRPFVTLS